MKPPFRLNIEVALLAGVLFWVPRLVGHVVWASSFTSREVRILTFLLPAVAFAGLWIAARIHHRFTVDGMGSLLAVAGIWILGPLFMTSGWSMAQERELGLLGWIVAVVGTALFPIFTFMMSVYDGTLGALAITTTTLLIRAVLVWPRPLVILPERK